MPTYEYICSACGHAFERFESITAKPNKSCEKCGKKKAERQISAGGGFLFKGSGFYITDYKKSGGAAPAKESKPAETKASESCPCGEKPAAACDAKPAKSESKSESKSSKTKVA